MRAIRVGPDTLECLPAFKALEVLRNARTTLGLVLDEFGGVEGVITLTDLLEALVGDIPAERGGNSADIVRREDGSWLIDGMLPMIELREALDWDETPGERRGDYQTVGGFVLDQVGRVPNARHRDFRDRLAPQQVKRQIDCFAVVVGDDRDQQPLREGRDEPVRLC